MKQLGRRLAAFGLALLLTASTALASEAMGNEVRGGVTPLSVGTSLSKQIFWSDTYSDLRTERYTTYTPNQDVTPTVAYGDKVLSRATLTKMAQSLESLGRRVVSGINGDYYVLATGAPLGIVITDGVLRSSSSWHLAVGFREDGSAFIGTPSLSITAAFGGQLYAVTGGINKVRKLYSNSDNTGGLVLLTSDFSANTQNTEPGVDVILTPVLDYVGQDVVNTSGVTLVQSGQLTVNGRVTCTVDQVLESKGSIDIPAGKLVMSINAKDTPEMLAAVRALKPGDSVELDVTTPDSRFAGATQAVGAMYKLVTNGAVEKPQNSSAQSAWAERTARTAIGIKADGTVIFYTMDGRQPGYSVGCTLQQVAMRMVELGCVEAASLDGGGSTTIGATLPDQSSMGIQNKPSDGSSRANSVAVFLTTDLRPTGTLGSFYVTPSDSMLLAGASVQVTANALDTAYYPMTYGGGVSYFIYSGDGTVTTDGLFTAGSENGVSQVTAAQGDASGVATMTVVKVPDTIAVTNEATGASAATLNVSPGQQVNLKASSTYKGMALTSQDTCYTWSVDPAIGTIDKEGLFTASSASGSGTITVSAGGRIVTIPVSVAGHIKTLEDFESGVDAFTSTESASASVETAAEYVRYGRQSMKVDYHTASGTAGLAADLAIPDGETHLGLWIYGNGSGDVLTAAVSDGANVSSLTLASLSFTGWQHFNVPLPAMAKKIQGLNIISASGAVNTPAPDGNGNDSTEGTEGAGPDNAASAASGTIWLDQITTSNLDITDGNAPTVKVSLSGTALTAAVTDDVDKDFPAASVTLTYDGKPLEAQWNGVNTLTAALPVPDGKAHRATVTAVDASGTLGRASVDVPASAGANVYEDMAAHWAAPYANFLYTTGVASSVEAGAVKFAPDRKITRGEFFAMTARWMGLDLNAYADVVLPFADTDSIPAWALGEIKAMYSLGIVKGSEAGGVVTVNAGANISRAEAMTILGRTQAKGYPAGALAFADSADVPAWALPYVQSLVSQGVVTGSVDNRINPNLSITRGEVAKLLYAML